MSMDARLAEAVSAIILSRTSWIKDRKIDRDLTLQDSIQGECFPHRSSGSSSGHTQLSMVKAGKIKPAEAGFICFD